jgi:hypothetical protein
MKSLLLTPDRHDEWRRLLEDNDPTATAIRDALRSYVNGSIPLKATQNHDLDQAMHKLILAWIEGDAKLSLDGLGELKGVLDRPPHSDLGKGSNALAAVQAWDFGQALWPEAERRAFAGRLASLARSILEITPGNPHIVTNNWWMITHGGCLLAGLAANGEEGPDGPQDLTDLIDWALGRFKAFCSIFGNAGLYHEGSGYISYTLSMLMPALVAVERHLDPGILEAFPQLRKSIPSMLAGAVTAWHQDSGADNPSFGISLQWNDAGRGSVGLNPLIPGMVVAPEEWKGALRTLCDRLIGVDGPGNWGCVYRGLGLAVALYPFSIPRAEPRDVLPREVWDQRQGLGIWRSDWGSGDESVLGWYARTTAPGGHRQDDAASVRLISLGRTWICSGGQARPKAEWQSVFTHADMEDRPRPAPLAYVFSIRTGDQGGVVGIDTRQSLGAYAERYLSWRTDLGPELVLAMLDLLDDHAEPGRDWQWSLSFPRELEHRIHPDGAGFSLVDPEKGTLTGRFLIDCPTSLEVREMPASSRTFSNGKKVDYPGDTFIRGGFDCQKRVNALVCLTLNRPGTDLPKVTLSDKAIRLGDTTWQHPFHPAILKEVDLAQSIPNRMTLPAG